MSWENVWEEVFRTHDWGKYPAEDLIRFVARSFYRAHNRGDVRILELGCGTGANLWFMAREGFAVYGIEGSRTAVGQARRRLDDECPGWVGEIICGDFSSPLPFEDGFFDGVVDNEAIYCNPFEVSKAIYTEGHRVLKAGGKLFSRTFATGSYGYGTGQQVGHNAFVVSEGPMLGKG